MEINAVGKRIAELRKNKGWSQMELAEQLNVSDKTVSKWENGGLPGIDLFPKLSKIFNVSIDYLMVGVEESAEKLTDCDGGDALDNEDESFQDGEEKSPEEDFLEEIEALDTEQLQLILSDQQHLYKKEEIAKIRSVLAKRMQNQPRLKHDSMLSDKELENIAISRLPKDYVCPKCDGINETPGRYCVFCHNDLLGWGPPVDMIRKKESTDQTGTSAGCLFYFLAFLIPIFGIIMGAIKRDKGLLIFSGILQAINLLISFSILITAAGM